jgi:PPOX class probable F420-dependent enzyme
VGDGGTPRSPSPDHPTAKAQAGDGGAREQALARLGGARVGHLGTVGPDGGVRLVPTCFALDDDRLVSAVDHKPKTTTALARLADIERTGRATLLVDHYDDEDWSALWWVRVSGPATVLSPTEPRGAAAVDCLVDKYPQYRRTRPAGPVSAITIESLTWWSATP